MGEWRRGRIDVRVEHVARVDFNVEAQIAQRVEKWREFVMW